MLELLKYELKKIIMRKSAHYTCIAVLVALCGIMASTSCRRRRRTTRGDPQRARRHPLPSRIRPKAHEGRSPTRRVSQELETYHNVSFEKIDPDELAQMSRIRGHHDAISDSTTSKPCSSSTTTTTSRG